MNSPNHKISRVVFLLLAATLLLLSTVPALAQQTGARPDRGAMPGAAYSISDLESVSLTNGNMNVSIPLASLPPMAGGKLGLTLSAVYNSKLWNVTRTEYQALYTQGCQSWVVSTPQLSEVGGWRIAGGQYQLVFRDAREDFDYVVPPSGPPASCESDTAEYNRLMSHWKRVVLIGPDGAEHELRPVDNYQPYGPTGGSRPYLFNYYKDTPQTTNSPMRYYSFDGSFLSAIINPQSYSTQWTVYLKDGTKIVQTSDGVQRITDTNGNSIKIFGDLDGNGNPVMHYQDEQTGREIKYTDDPTGNDGERQTHVEYQTVTGVWQTTNINWGTTDVQGKLYRVEDWTPFGGESGEGVHCYYDVELGTDLVVIREIVFPVTEPGVAPRQFSFEYNSDETESATDQAVGACSMAPQSYTRTASKGLGGLSQITTPSGAVANYAYSRDNEHSFTLFSETDLMAKETVTQKQLTHDGTTETWTYSIDEIAGNGGGVTNPDGSTLGEQSYSHNPALSMYFGPNSGKAGLVFRSSQSNKVKIERHWTMLLFDGGNAGAAGSIGQLQTFNPVVDVEYTTLLDDTPNHNPVKTSAKTFQYDYNGNLLSTTEYDWFDPASMTYGSEGVPTGVPAGATVLRTTNNTFHNAATSSNSANVYAKRSLSTATPLILNALQQSTTGDAVAQLSYDSNSYGTAPTVGNLTGKSVFNDVDDDWITTSMTYNSYGNVTSVTDGRLNVTNFYYDDSTHAAPTRVEVDPENSTGTQTTTTEFDFYTGLVKSTTDPNGSITTIDYINHLLGAIDPFGRPGIVKGPAVTIGGSSQRQRMTTTYEDHLRRVTTATDLYAEDDKLVKTRTTADMLGRPVLTEQTEDGTNYTIFSKKAYDPVNRITYSSSPMHCTIQSANSCSSDPLQYVVTAATNSWTRATSDVLGRSIEVATFAGATQPTATGTTGITGTVTSAYDANFTTVTDQAGKQRRSMVDALGRLLRVDEPNDSGSLGTTASPNQATSYAYDVFGNLVTVTQGSQTRYFMYDSLSRLIRARNPEQGTLAALNLTDPISDNSQWSSGYVYDDNGNLTSKTDARGITTSYVYDSLNRVTLVLYRINGQPDPNTGDVEYLYDNATNGKGRPWLTFKWGSQPFQTAVGAYDALGRVTQLYRLFGNGQGGWNPAYEINATYDLAGHVKTMTYPSRHSVTYNYDNAGRLADKDAQNLAFTGNLGDGGTPRTYAMGISYSSLGGLQEERFGTTTPIYHKQRYNVRGQLWDMRASTVSFATDPANGDRGAIVNYYSSNFVQGGSGTDNNGNLLRQENYIPGSDFFQSNFDYDSLNRLTSITEKLNGTGNPSFKQTYFYDRWGNRRIDTDPAKTFGDGVNNLEFHVDNDVNGTNRLYAPGDLALPMEQRQMRYDPAGNLNHDSYTGQGIRVYDAENKIVEAQGNGQLQYYSYDGDGLRVKRKVDQVETWQVYGIGGELLAEYAANGAATSPQKEYGYRNGELLITATVTVGSGGSAFSFTDDPLVVGTTSVRAAHLNELRTAVNQARVHAGLSAASWSESITAGVTTIKASHVTELRTRLDEARTALLLSTGGYTDPALANGYDIKAAHISELRTKTNEALTAGGGTSLDLHWLVSDQLGTPRMIFDQTGNLANVSRHDYLPFGEELFAGTGGRTAGLSYTNADGARQKFTQKERDIETGLDYFGARYFSSTQGRFASVDPAPIKKKHLINPQDLNRYSYVANNPLAFIDPDGEEKIRVIVRTFIPQKTVSGPHPNGGIRKFEGDNRDIGKPGTYRTQQIITIETDPRRNNGSPIYGKPERDTGMTVEHGWLRNYSKKASGDTLEASVNRSSDVVNIQAKGNENNPLVMGSPGITHDFMIGVQSEGNKGNLTVTVNGEHDGFPAYEILIVRPETGDNTERVVYGHDPRKTGQTAASLYPPAEVKVNKKCVQKPGGECQ